MKILEARSAVVKDVVEAAHSKLESISQGGKYKQMLQDLLTQGLLQLQETDVSVSYRKEDEALVKEVLPKSVQAYKDKMRLEVNVTLDKEYLPPAPSKAGTGPSWCVLLPPFLSVCCWD